MSEDSWLTIFCRPRRATPTDLNDDTADLCACLMEPHPALDVVIAMHRFNCPDWQTYGTKP